MALFDGGAPLALFVLFGALAYVSVWLLFWLGSRGADPGTAAEPVRGTGALILLAGVIAGQVLAFLAQTLDLGFAATWRGLGLDGHFMLLAAPAAFLGLAMPCWRLSLETWGVGKTLRWASLWVLGLLLLLISSAIDSLLAATLGNAVLPQAWFPLAVSLGSRVTVHLVYAAILTFLLLFAFMAVEHLRPSAGASLPAQILVAASAYVLLTGVNHPMSALATACLVTVMARAGAPVPIRALAVLAQIYVYVFLSLWPIG